jgi:hypothetical protein
MDVNENCIDKIMDCLENTMKIEDAKSIQIEKAHRLSHNFRTEPFEIFHVHILITLFPLDSFSVEFASHSAAS